MTNPEVRIDLYDGKYTYVRKEGASQRALRYGKEWRDLTGDGFILAMAQEIEELKEKLGLYKDFKPFSKCSIKFLKTGKEVILVSGLQGILLPDDIHFERKEDQIAHAEALRIFYKKYKEEIREGYLKIYS